MIVGERTEEVCEEGRRVEEGGAGVVRDLYLTALSTARSVRFQSECSISRPPCFLEHKHSDVPAAYILTTPTPHSPLMYSNTITLSITQVAARYIDVGFT